MAGPTTLFQTGVHGSRPAANAGCVLYSCTTHSLIYRSDGSTWTTYATLGSVSTTVATDPLWDAAGDLALGTGADTASKLTKGSAGQGLVAGSSTLSWTETLPWHIWIPATIVTPDATTGTWAIGQTTTQDTFPFYRPGSTANSGGAIEMSNTAATAQNDAFAIDVVLAQGTWDANFWVRKSTVSGIITLQQDGSDMGTVDTYAAANAAAKVSITGWAVSTTGKKRMNLKMATKNASSTNYALLLHAIEFRRTA